MTRRNKLGTNALAVPRPEQDGDRDLPVRVLVAAPPSQLTSIRAWLDASCGAEGWAAAPAGGGGVVNDAIAFYFEDPATARAFVNRFCCGYRVKAGADPLALPHDTPLRSARLRG